MKRFTDSLGTFLAVVAGLSLVLMMVHVTLDVLGKYFLRQPVPGTAEIVASYYMISTVFLPLAYIEAHNRPIVVELFYDRFPSGLQLPLDVLGTAASLAFYAFLGWQSTRIALDAMAINEVVDGAWRVVIWPSRFLLPLGLAATCLVLLVRLGLVLGGRRHLLEHAAAPAF